MRTVLVLKSDIILKGDGNYAYFNGVPHLISNPPPEAFNHSKDENGEDIDAPLFAHAGNSRPHPSAHAGMGELLPGGFTRGKHGNLAYHSDGFNHYHGHDGVWHQLGEALERKGITDVSAKDLLSAAIQKYNLSHQDKSGHHHLPEVDSPEWRRIRAAPYNASMEPGKRPNRSTDGHFITTFTNRPNRKEKVGHFTESYSVPYWNELAEIAQNLGLDDIASTEWLTRGHISIDDLHPAGRRLKGRGGDMIGPDGQLPDSHLTSAPGGVAHQPAFNKIQSWEVAQHFPDLMHYKLATQRSLNTETQRSANGHIQQALKRAAENPDIIPDVQVPINTAQTSGGTNYTMQPLKTVLRSADMTKNLLNELGSTSALTGLFGRLKSGGQKRPNSGARIFGHLLDAFGGDPDEEGKRSKYDMLMQHAIQGEHVPLDPEFMSGADGRKHPTKNGSTHKNAAQLYVKAMLARDSGTELRNYAPDAATLKTLGVSGEGIEQEQVDARRTAVEGIADLMARAFGHQERRPLVEADDMPTSGLASRQVMGYPQDLIPAIPEHVPFTSDLAMAPSTPTPDTNPRPTPAPRPVTEGLPAPPPSVAPRPPQANTVGVMPRGPLSAQQQEARGAVGGFDAPNLRSFMQQTGLGPRAGTGAELTEQEQRFQQSFGDPRQRLLTEYMKGQDRLLPEGDRLMKAMETMQRDDAMNDVKVMKHVFARPVNIADNNGIQHLAKQVGLTPTDVRSIAHQMGDWDRIAKRLNVNSDVVKVVKLSTGGI